jgi:hypothetical protein
MKKIDKYKPLIGRKYGKLIFAELVEAKSEKGNLVLEMIFICDCGAKKQFTAHNASKIFCGDTVSCGCVRKAKWAREFHTWKKNWDERFPE